MGSTTIPATSKELQDRIQNGWWGFWPLAWTIGERKMRERTSAGWTYQEMLAHIAAWERATASRLARLRESGDFAGPPSDDDDEFNARVAAEARGKRAREVIRELADAHDALTHEVEALSDEQFAANEHWARAIVAGNTFDHYAEHQVELESGLPWTRDELVARMEEGWGRFWQAVGFVGSERLERTTPAGWTGKALLAHIARWLEGVPPELPVRLEGRRSPQPDVDAVNARSAEQAATLPARRSVERVERAYRAVRDAVRALPDGTLPLMVLRLVAGETFNHFSEHDAELAALRPRTATELAARVDEAWRPVRERIREIGRGRMGESLPNGWTYKDLVGHIAAWEEYGERGIRDWRAGRFAEMSDADVDAFNAREVENRKLVGAEAILDELDTAHRRLVEIARTLTEDELRERIPLSLVAWDTYLHYPDHAQDLGIAD